MKKNFIIYTISILLLLSCSVKQEALMATRDNNVCKMLKGRVVLYAIFVDSKYTKPWTAYDITSTLDSIRYAMDWVQSEASKSNVALDVVFDYHVNKKGQIPIFNNFRRKTLSGTLFFSTIDRGLKDVYAWADKIASEAGKSFPKDTVETDIILTKNKLNDRERLIAQIRNKHKTDNVALVYFINNYYTNEISVAFDTYWSNNIEFAIVSYKSPAVIAHEFLHLFGAWDLYITPFDRNKKVQRKKEIAMKLFPNEIMAFAYRDIDSLQVSNFSKYLIGWQNQLDSTYSRALFGRKIKPAKY